MKPSPKHFGIDNALDGIGNCSNSHADDQRRECSAVYLCIGARKGQMAENDAEPAGSGLIETADFWRWRLVAMAIGLGAGYLIFAMPNPIPSGD